MNPKSNFMSCLEGYFVLGPVCTVIFTLSLLASSAAQASGSSVRGGGDEVALEFHSSFAAAIQTIKSDFPDLLSDTQMDDLVATAHQARLIVVETVLSTVRDGVVQFSIAENDPDRKLILVNRTRWQSLKARHIREALALHEIASLLRIEATGYYPISSKYIAKFGLRTDALEPTKGRCFAPRSEQSACEQQLADASFNEVDSSLTLVFLSPKSHKTVTKKMSFSGQRMTFYDENKIYDVLFMPAFAASPKAMLSLSILGERPTGEPRQAEMTRKVLNLVIDGDRRVKPLPVEEMRYLIYRSEANELRGEIINPTSGKVVGRFINDDFPNGASIQTSYENDLGLAMGKDGILQSKVTIDVLNPIERLSPLNRFGIKKDLESRILSALESFAAHHETVNKLKGALNQCRQDCVALREQYETADRRRDEDFMNFRHHLE